MGRVFPFSKPSRWALGPIQSPIQRVKRTGRKVDPSQLSGKASSLFVSLLIEQCNEVQSDTTEN